MKYLLFTLALFLYSCTRKPDFAQEEQAIRLLQQQERTAHFNRNIDLFLREFSDSMISINRGTVKYTPPDTLRISIQKYFGQVQFIKWDDLSAPIIRFSDDGTLAYAIIRKEVVAIYADKPGNDTAYYAWTSIYRKTKGEWKLECNVSTNK
jgi:hypothetical protein